MKQCPSPLAAPSFLGATPAKINLGLKILRRRADGYHDIYTVMEPISLADILYGEFHPEREDFTLNCPQLPELDPAANLVLRAARAVAAVAQARGLGKTGGWEFFLDKRIPSGAGLGGGSSNAGAVIRELEAFYGLVLTPTERLELALTLGADVPFFLVPRLALVEGIGERVTFLGSPRRRWYLLVQPPFAVNTASAYSALEMSGERTAPEWDLAGLTQAAAAGRLPGENDFEIPVGASHPELYEIKAALAARTGCLGALMSGSGSVVYGVFADFAAVTAAAGELAEIWAGRDLHLFSACNLGFL
jgi:4-diphosphocytidyl-2-C-methyl-D-erythritol kinase